MDAEIRRATEVSIPKRVSEALNRRSPWMRVRNHLVSIPKRVSEALNLVFPKIYTNPFAGFNP